MSVEVSLCVEFGCGYGSSCFSYFFNVYEYRYSGLTQPNGPSYHVPVVFAEFVVMFVSAVRRQLDATLGQGAGGGVHRSWG